MTDVGIAVEPVTIRPAVRIASPTTGPFSLALLITLLAGGCATPATHPVAATGGYQTRVASLPAGRVVYDLFLPQSDRPAPLVVVAHGFLRGRGKMRGWGEYLSQHGFVVAIPTLPTVNNHPHNAKAMIQLIEHLREPSVTVSASMGNGNGPGHDNAIAIDGSRVAVMGYSSGGLSTFLAAAQSDVIDLWIGLDPVDRRRAAVKAAPKVRCRVVRLMAEPADCNKDANWDAVKVNEELSVLNLVINGSIHTDCESPTDALVVVACGRPDPRRTQTFFEYAMLALRAHLMNDRAAAEKLADLSGDPRVRPHTPEPKLPGSRR